MLSKLSEYFYSTLGCATILIATPLYLVWATIAVGFFRAKQAVGSGQVSASIISLVELSDIFLFFGGALTYLAAAAFAASLGQIRWFGRTTTWVFVTMSLVALLFLVVRGLWFPDPKIVFRALVRDSGIRCRDPRRSMDDSLAIRGSSTPARGE